MTSRSFPLSHARAILPALALAIGSATPALARDWSAVTAAANDLYREMSGRTGPFAAAAPDTVPTSFGFIAAADLLDRGCRRVPGEPAAETIRAAIDELRVEIEARRLNVAVSVAKDGGSFSVRLIAQLLRGCPAASAAVPAPTPAPNPASPTPPPAAAFDRAGALRLLDQLRALIAGAR